MSESNEIIKNYDESNNKYDDLKNKYDGLMNKNLMNENN